MTHTLPLYHATAKPLRQPPISPFARCANKFVPAAPRMAVAWRNFRTCRTSCMHFRLDSPAAEGDAHRPDGVMGQRESEPCLSNFFKPSLLSPVCFVCCLDDADVAGCTGGPSLPKRPGWAPDRDPSRRKRADAWRQLHGQLERQRGHLGNRSLRIVGQPARPTPRTGCKSCQLPCIVHDVLTFVRWLCGRGRGCRRWCRCTCPRWCGRWRGRRWRRRRWGRVSR